MTEKIDNNNGPNKITGIGKDTLNSIIENAKSQLPIEAIGIGGSLATKRQDTYSDFDIFLFYPTKAFLQNVQLFPIQIQHCRQVVVASHLKYISGYGHLYSYVFTNKTQIDYFLICEETIDMIPIRAKTQIIYDKTGNYTRILSSIKNEIKNNSINYLDAAISEYVLRLMKIRKNSFRKKILPLITDLDKLRAISIGLDYCALTGDYYTSEKVEAHIENKMGKEYVDNILRTVPQCSFESIIKVFKVLRNNVLNRIDELVKLYPINGLFRDVESELYHEIINLLGETNES